MDPLLRIVTRLPLGELWDSAGPLGATRGADLTDEDVRDRLRQGPVRFVVADIGLPLRWLDEHECYAFWKTEIAPRLADPRRPIFREDYPGEYIYLATDWSLEDGARLILLEKHH